MHTVLVILAGAILLGLFLLFGHLWGGTTPSLAIAAKLFIPAWVGISIANLWVGVSRAGHSVAEETPILLLVFLVPAILAVLLAWQLGRA